MPDMNVSKSISGKEIKLFELYGAQREDPLVGRIRHISLPSDIEFEALSWRWGTELSSETIQVDESFIRTRSKLVSALRRLRLTDTSRLLWIDAICIDQTSQHDKERQIPFMGDIYRCAQRVLIWLGGKAHRFKRVIPAIEKLASDICDQKALAVIEGCQEEWNQIYRGVKQCTLIDFMVWLCRFRYWKRLWVVQEIAVASQATILCGSEYLDFDTLIRAYDRILKLEPKLRFLNTYPAISSIDQRLGLFRDCRKLRKPSLEMLVTMCRGQLSSDPRDKIYGLLGLAFDAYPPRYDIDIREVFEGFTLHILRSSLFAFSQAIRYWWEEEEDNDNRPSWMPRWTAANRHEYPQIGYRLRQELLFDAGGPSGPVEYIDGALMVRGIIIDEVSCSGISRWEDGKYYGIPNVTFLREWGKEQIFWETWAHGQELVVTELRRCSQEFVSECIDWGRKYCGEGSASFCQGLWKVTDIALYHSSFFITKTGNLGLNTRTTVPGDIICILAGAHLPVILRKSGAFYTLVSECFVHGIMDGEATHDSYWAQKAQGQKHGGNAQWQNLHLR